MVKEHRHMKWWQVLVLGLAVGMTSACGTRANPKSCADGLCTDQRYPFCDVDGTLGGEANECIAVTCTAGEFAACRSDQELRCNSTGNDYDVVQCELGCSVASNGCRLCEPNETRCTNGAVATCDASGNVTSMEACPLGCFEDKPRCRALEPSNDLGQYLDMVPVGPDIKFANAIFEVDTGQVRVGAQLLSVPSFLMAPVANGVPIRVFVANSIELDSATIEVTGDPRDPPSAAVAFVSHGDVVLRGEIIVQPRVGGAVAGCAAAGAGDETDSGNPAASGGGGGANGTDGADGGEVTGVLPRGSRGTATNAANLVPLRGGCTGGFGFSGGSSHHTGGGALQVSSKTRIEVDGTINVRGRDGYVEQSGFGNGLIIGGGGAGGSILLEAPTVSLTENANISASGGKGAQGCGITTTYCGAGGSAATPNAPASTGASVPYTTTPNTLISAGGGGGGLGRLRINTKTGMYSKTVGAYETAVVSTGVVGTK